MSKSPSDLPPPPKHPLQQLREILRWSREECAKETGLKASTIQNIERGAAPLPEEAAFAIEAATSCNALALMESSEAWRVRSKGGVAEESEAGSEMFAVRLAPQSLKGAPFTKGDYESYKSTPLEPESVEAAINDLCVRIDLLLGPLGLKPQRFRRMYRYLVQILNRERRESGPTDPEMAEYALNQGKAELKVMSIGQLADEKDVTRSPVWQKAKILERFQPEQQTHVVVETFPFWPFTEVLDDDDNYYTPDFVFGRRVVWRITLPDGKPLVVTVNKTKATGLRAKLPETKAKQKTSPATQMKEPVFVEPESPPTDASPASSAPAVGGSSASGSTP